MKHTVHIINQKKAEKFLDENDKRRLFSLGRCIRSDLS